MLQWRHVYVQVHCDRVKIHQRDTKTNMLGLKSAYESLGINGTNYSRMGQEKFVEESLLKADHTPSNF